MHLQLETDKKGAIGMGRFSSERRRTKCPGGGRLSTCRVVLEEAGGPECASTCSGAASTGEFHTKLLDSQTLDECCTTESVLHDTLAMLASSQRAKSRSRRQKQILTITPSCIYVRGGKSKSTTFVHDVGHVVQFEVAKDNQMIFGYTAVNPSTENLHLLCFQTPESTKMSGVDVQSAYFAACSIWAEAQAQEQREVEERQTVISAEIHSEDQATEEEEDEWFDAMDDLAFQTDSHKAGEEEEWFDAMDVFEGETTEAIETACELRQTQPETDTEIQEVPESSGQRENILLKSVRMKIARLKCRRSRAANSSSNLGKKRSWVHTLCRTICCVSPNTNGQGSGSSLEETQDTDTDMDDFPNNTDDLTSTTAQDVLLVERDPESQCHGSDGQLPTEGCDSLPSLPSEESMGQALPQRPCRSVHWGSVLILHISDGRPPWTVEYWLPDLPRVPRPPQDSEVDSGLENTIRSRNQVPKEIRV